MVPDEFLDTNYSFIICPICQDRFEEPILQCSSGHCFCSKCIEEWMDRNSTCPTCRKTISSHSLSRNLLIEQAIEELVNNHQIAEIITKKEKSYSRTPRRQSISRKAKNYCKFIYLNLFFAFIFVVIAFTYHEGNKIDVKSEVVQKTRPPLFESKKKMLLNEVLFELTSHLVRGFCAALQFLGDEGSVFWNIGREAIIISTKMIWNIAQVAIAITFIWLSILGDFTCWCFFFLGWCFLFLGKVSIMCIGATGILLENVIGLGLQTIELLIAN